VLPSGSGGVGTAMKITNEVLEGYLNCKLKAHLKARGEQSIRTDYEALLLSRRDEVRLIATDKILAAQGEGQVARSIALTADSLKSGPSFDLDAFEEDLVLEVGRCRRCPPSWLGAFHTSQCFLRRREGPPRAEAPAGTRWPAAGERPGWPRHMESSGTAGLPQLPGRSEAWPG
jgi:hypothetical protein